jgi:phage terminase large subunit-like protein
VPEGRDVGKPIVLRPWQRREMLRIYDNPHGTRRAILSFGRKNGKTAFAALLLLLHLCGPESRPNSQLNSAAQSRDQAAILFALAAKMVRMSPDLSEAVNIRDTAKQLYCPERGTLYRALSADATTAYGLSPAFIVHDELGQVRGPKSELYEALETATAAQESPLTIIISTQAPTDADLLSVLIDDAKAGHDPRVVLSLYTAPEDLDPFCEEAIKAANPAYGDFQSRDEVLAMAEDARRMPTRESEYRNLILNQRVAADDPFLSPSLWDANAGEPDFDTFARCPVYVGADLSATQDLTSVVACAVDEDGVWHVRPWFFLPRDNIREKSRTDRVPYDLWEKQGFLITTPGRTVDEDFVAAHVAGALKGCDVQAFSYDRWQIDRLKKAFARVGYEQELVEFGQGFKSMSPALKAVETLALQTRLRHGNNPVLTMCIANSRVEMDAAGNRKLTKKRALGRIDGAVALVMAIGSADSLEAEDLSIYDIEARASTKKAAHAPA